MSFILSLALDTGKFLLIFRQLPFSFLIAAISHLYIPLKTPYQDSAFLSLSQ